MAQQSRNAGSVDTSRLRRHVSAVGDHLHLTQAELADKVHVSCDTISRLERGDSDFMSLEMIVSLSDLLARSGISIGWFFSDCERDEPFVKNMAALIQEAPDDLLIETLANRMVGSYLENLGKVSRPAVDNVSADKTTRRQRRWAAKGTVAGTCRICGCTDDRACIGGCEWVDDSHTLCSVCYEDRKEQQLRSSQRRAAKGTQAERLGEMMASRPEAVRFAPAIDFGPAITTGTGKVQVLPDFISIIDSSLLGSEPFAVEVQS